VILHDRKNFLNVTLLVDIETGQRREAVNDIVCLPLKRCSILRKSFFLAEQPLKEELVCDHIQTHARQVTTTLKRIRPDLKPARRDNRPVTGTNEHSPAMFSGFENVHFASAGGARAYHMRNIGPFDDVFADRATHLWPLGLFVSLAEPLIRRL